MADVEVDADQFGATLEQLLEGVGNDVRRKLPDAVSGAAKVARREVKSNARANFKFTPKDRYLSGWTYRVKKDNEDEIHATVGNSNVPGLPHLLEKGHATVGSNGVKRVAGREHIASAAQSGFDEFERTVGKVVDSL